jgi:hypothetical protein
LIFYTIQTVSLPFVWNFQVTIIEKDETNGLLLQQTNLNGKKNCLEVLTKADLVRYANAPGWNRIRKTLLLLLLVVILGLIGGAIYVVAIQRTCPPEPWSTSWWKHSLMYQISVKSFQDSNGDGVGDLAGKEINKLTNFCRFDLRFSD